MINNAQQLAEVEEVEDLTNLPTTALARVSPQRVSVHTVVLCPCCGFKFYPGEETIPDLPFPEPDNPTKGMKLTTRIKQVLNEREMNEDGSWNYRFDKVARTFVSLMESGHMGAISEFLNRLEGRTAARIANADGTNLKMYGSEVPLDGPEAP